MPPQWKGHDYYAQLGAAEQTPSASAPAEPPAWKGHDYYERLGRGELPAPTAQPTVAPEESFVSRAIGKPLSVVSWMGQKLGAPQQGLFELIDAAQEGRPAAPWEQMKKTWRGEAKPITGSDLLGNAGMAPGWMRSAAGLGVDIVADPLNVIGGVARQAARVAPALRHLAPAEVVGKAADVALSSPEISKRMAWLVRHPVERAMRDTISIAEAKKAADLHARVKKTVDAFVPAVKAGEEARFSIPEILERQLTPTDPLKAHLPGGSVPLAQADPAALESAANVRALMDEQYGLERAAGTIGAPVTDKGYYPYVFQGSDAATAAAVDLIGRRGTKRLSAVHAKPRELESYRQAVTAAGKEGRDLILDPVEAVATRVQRGTRMMHDVNMIRELAKGASRGKPWAVALKEGDEVPKGYQRLSLTYGKEMPAMEELKGYAFQTPLAQDLSKHFGKPYQLGPNQQTFRDVNALWKQYTTQMNPGFHATNILGNAAQSVTLGGMNPLMLPVRWGQAIAGKKFDIGAGKYTGAQVRKAAEDLGVTGVEFGQFHTLQDDIASQLRRQGVPAPKGVQDWTPAGVARTVGQATGEFARNPFGAARPMQALGQAAEDTARMGLFRDALAKGATPEQAYLTVRDALFNYAEIPDTVRKARDLGLPYITWMYKNLPKQLMLPLRDPAAAAMPAKIKRALGEDVNEASPEFAQERGMVKSGLRTEAGSPVLLDPNLPQQDLEIFQSLLSPTKRHSSILRTLPGQVSPLWGVPVSLALNNDIRTGRPIQDEHPFIMRRGGEPAVTKTGRAPEFLTMLRQQPSLRKLTDAIPGLATTPEVSRQTGAVEERMPAVEAFIARQLIPGVLNQAGRLGAPPELIAEDPANLRLAGIQDKLRALGLGGLNAPLAFRWATGMSAVPMSDEMGQRALSFKRNEIRDLMRQAEAIRSRQAAAQRRALDNLAKKP